VEIPLMRSETRKATPYLTFIIIKKGLHNMRDLPETPIIFLVYSPKSYFPAFWGPFCYQLAKLII
jgi:hypothetical protein